MPLTLPVLEADSAYISDMLWLPKQLIPVDVIKKALQYYVVSKGKAFTEKLWLETAQHLVVPREFIAPAFYKDYAFPFIDLRPRSFPRTGIRFKGMLWEDQQAAAAALAATDGGILNLSPGKGKTVCALYKAALRQVPTLIIVHNTTLFDQWYEEEIPEFVELPPGECVGRIQGPVFDWKHPICVAMIHSLGKRIQDGRIPDELRRYFGLMVWDEVHHVSARTFKPTASLGLGEREGLSGTVEREDHLEFIFKYHLGDIYFQDLSMDMIPEVHFQLTPIKVALDDPDVIDKGGDLNISKLRTVLGKREDSNAFREQCIRADLDAGYKVFCISHSKEQAYALASKFPGAAILVQESARKKRLQLVRESRIAFSVAQLGTEGLNDKRIDSLHWLTAFKNKKDLRQALGRLQRKCPDKKPPKMVIYEDVYIKPITDMCQTLRRHLSELGLRFKTIPAPRGK